MIGQKDAREDSTDWELGVGIFLPFVDSTYADKAPIVASEFLLSSLMQLDNLNATKLEL